MYEDPKDISHTRDGRVGHRKATVQHRHGQHTVLAVCAWDQ